MNKPAFSLCDFNRLFADENAARQWFEQARWPDGPVCPACESIGVARWLDNARPWQCRACRRQFSVTRGTTKHLGRYALEAAFRWNRKLDGCLARMAGLIRRGEGRMLPYRVLTAPA